MIGRDEQLREARAFIGRAIDGTSSANVLFVTGEAGIGKTTLLDAIERRVAHDPSAPTVVRAACSTPLAGREIGGVEALEPWAALMSAVVRAPSRSTVAGRLIAELARAWVRVIPVVGDVIESTLDTAKIIRDHSGTPKEAPASQQQLFQQYVNFLAELSTQGPIVLMLDDAHWADASSVNLLFTAARQLHDRPIAFIVAYRPDDAATLMSGAGHPIVQVRAELERYGLAAALSVPRLLRADLVTMLQTLYPGYAGNEAFEQWLDDVGGGNALFITQFLVTLEQDGRIDPATGTVRPDYASVPTPVSARAVIEERIRRLESEQRELLRYASVEGDTFTATVLARVADQPHLRLLQRLRLVEESHALVRSLGRVLLYANEMQAWQFSHGLVQRTLYDGLDAEERRMIHEIALEVLREEWHAALAGERNVAGTAARLAVHASVAGEHLFAAGVLLEGAREAWRRYAENEALRLLDECDRAVESAERSEDDARLVRAGALVLRGRIDYHAGRLGESVERFEAARAMAANEPVGIDAATGLADALFWLGRYQESDGVARSAIERAVACGYPKGESAAAQTIGGCLAEAGMAEAALEWYERALVAARRCGEQSRHVSSALNSLGKLQRRLGALDGALESFMQALAMSRLNHDRTTEANVLNNLGTLETSRGNDERARAWLEECLAVCRASANDWTAAYCEANIAVLAGATGDHEESLRRTRSALAACERVGDAVMQARLLGNVASIELELGDRAAARATLERALALGERLGNADVVADLCSSLAELTIHEGNPEAARAYALRTLEIARRGHKPETEGWGHGMLALVERHLAGLTPEGRLHHLREAAGHVRRCCSVFASIESRHLAEWEVLARQIDDELKAIGAPST